jgi:hypothetical protein
VIEIDGPKALDLMAEVVAGREDYVYERAGGFCVYAANGQPSCLVGQALARAGVTVAMLEEMDSKFETDIQHVREPEGLTLDDEARDFFGVAQRRQDDGEPWGKALADAEAEALALYSHKDGAERP